MGKENPPYYRYSVNQVLAELDSRSSGLTYHQAQYRLKNYGANNFQGIKRLNSLTLLAYQFKNASFLMLISLGILSLLSGFDKLASVLLFCAILNISITWYRSNKAQKLAVKLHIFTGSSALVVRDGKAGIVSSVNLTLGDIVAVKDGDLVSADLRVISEKDLIADDRIVSGDITPNKKFSRVINEQVPINDQDNLLFAGTKITKGSGRGIVIAVGKDTQLAKLISLNRKFVKNNLKMQRFMNVHVNLALQLCLVLIALTAATAIYKSFSFQLTIFFIIALSAAVLPNGLVVEVYGILSRVIRKTYSSLTKNETDKAEINKNDLVALNSALFVQNSLDKESQGVRVNRRSLFNFTNAFRSVLSASITETALVITGLISQIYYQVPLAITATQILAIDLAVMVWPAMATGWDSKAGSYNDDGTDPAKNIFPKRITAEIFSYSLLAAGLAYIGFLMFFSRRHITPVYISPTSLVYQQAVTLTMLILILCQYFNLIVLRSRRNKKFFNAYIWQNKKFVFASLFSLFVLINILYNPLLNRLLSTQPLSSADWFSAILLSVIYSSVVLVFRHSKKHTRREVIKLHKQVNSRKAPGSLPV